MNYRIYTLGDDGHIARVDNIEAADDTQIIAYAQQIQDGLPLEVWDGARMVIRLDRPLASKRG